MNIFKSLLLSLLLITNSSPVQASTVSFDIKDMFIESKGNNTQEARLKAKRKGVMRAFALIIDKMGLSNPGLEYLDYNIVSESIVVTKYHAETLNETSYSALAHYIFDYYKLEDIIYKYSDSEILNKMNQCIVIPIIKQGKKVYMFNDSSEWLKLWRNSEDLLKKYRIVTLHPNDIPNITNKNILTATYDQFRNTMQINRTKRIVIILAKYHTDLENGDSSLQVEYRNIYPDKVEIEEMEFGLPEESYSNLITKKVIDEFIANNGKLYDDSLEKHKSRIPKNVIKFNALNEEAGRKNLLVSFEVFSQGEWNELKKELESIDEVKNLKMLEQKGNLVTFVINYKNTLQHLVNSMYLKKIAYVKRKEQYFIIRIDDGI